MQRLTLKKAIETIETLAGNYEENGNILWDVFQEFEDSEEALEYAHRHIVRFGDTNWPEHFTAYLLPKDGTEKELVRFFELVLDPRRLNDETQQKLVEELLPLLALDGYMLVAHNFPYGKRIGYRLQRIDQPIDLINDQIFPASGGLFKYQFPAGLPFSLKKPSLAYVPEQGSQKAYFEDEPDVGVIQEDVYPDFTFQDLNGALQGKPIMRKPLIETLTVLNQTALERRFFEAYSSQFHMLSDNVPVLVPQAWIQWHSKPKVNLRATASSYTDDLYRVDFVVFWNHKRFAILIDDISHYGIRVGNRWDASEAAYSKRLKEDRKLRKEGWHVFRASNWEVRNENFVPEILNELREFIGFGSLKPAEVEDIPF